MSSEGGSAIPREIELKFDISSDDVPALMAHGLLKAGPAEVTPQTSVYFDTPDRRLMKAGAVLRVRESDGSYVQTLKLGEVAGSGAFNREEREVELDGPEPDLAMLDQTAIGRKINEKTLRGQLQPLFETVVERLEWQIGDNGHVVELVLDQGEVIAASATAPILEMELELGSGPADRLFDLARQLNESVPLRLGVLAKSERGYRLLDGGLDQVVKAEAVILSPSMTVGEGFQAIAMACIRHFRLNESRFTQDREGDALHQSRVALRRLRSALTLFKPAVSDRVYESIRSELRWISQSLGAARDLDVYLQRHLDSVAHSPKLWSRMLARREQVFDEAITALASERFRGLMISLVEWIMLGPWRSAEGECAKLRDQPVDQFAAQSLDELWRKLRKRSRHLARLSDEERHKARIAGKKLRYASEFFSSLTKGKKRQANRAAFTKPLEALQDQLGLLNDFATEGLLLAEIASHIRPVEQRRELLALVGHAEPAEKERRLEEAKAALDAMAKAGPFWR